MFCLAPTDNRRGECSAHAVEQCLSAIKKQDLNALEELYHRTSTSVFAFALSVLKNAQDAEDVMHDLYVLIWSDAEKYRPQGRPMAWIMTVTRNLCLQKCREYQRRSDIPQEDWEDYINASTGMAPDGKIFLTEALKMLTDEERQIVTLHAVAGFKHREIAELLKSPLPTILSKYSRAMKKLRKIYGGEQ